MAKVDNLYIEVAFGEKFQKDLELLDRIIKRFEEMERVA